MALYDRNAIEETSAYGVEGKTRSNLSVFIKQTYQLFAASLLAGAAGAYAGLGFAGQIYEARWILFIVELGLLFGLFAAKRKAGLNLALLFGFTFVSGLTLAPIISLYLSKGAGEIVAQAFVLTTVAFGGLSVFAMNTKRDFTTMGKMLFIALIVVVVAAILNLFMHSPILHLGISAVSAILFSAFVLYDTQNIIRGNYETPIEGAVQLYIDFLNIFVSLLNILGVIGDD